MSYEIVDTTGLECYTPDQVKVILQISQAQTYRLFNSEIYPDFKSFKLGKSWRITKVDFENWMEKLKEE